MINNKKLISFILAFALIFSTFGIVEFGASMAGTEYSIKYIQNGNFEQNIDSYKFSANYSQPNKTAVPYWDTTGTDGKLEFFKGTSAHFDVTKKKYPNNPEYYQVAEGTVAAELNATQESTIYQRIKTVSGSTYTWGLYHRGRDRTDRMVLIIGPEQSVNPLKPASKSPDQFVRITNWLKSQFGVAYPDIGCSKKYTVYSKPFAANGKFKNESSDENLNISLVETEEINQEWCVWVISSPYCNTSTEHTVNGWSAYGTNAVNDFDDIIQGASCSLGYDCTYTVPKGQTNTIFAFCSLSSGRETADDVTFGNLLDGINFNLYQPISTSTSQGGIGGADVEESDSSNVTIKSDILSGDPLHTVVLDGQYCTVHTSQYNGGTLTDCSFVGAYVTINNDDGTSSTRFVEPFTGDLSGYTDKEIEELAKNYFLPESYTDPETGKQWQYYFRVPVYSPVAIHLIYTKAPFVLYDSNGGKDYLFSPDNTIGGNLVGFANSFQKVFEKEIDGIKYYVDTSEYYYNYEATTDEAGKEIITPGKYISHAALPNDNWEKDADGTSPHLFCGWSVTNNNGEQIILDGKHTITYSPDQGNGGIVSFTDSDKTIENLLLDATHGITLTAQWKFTHRAQAQTLNLSTGEYEDTALGGTIEETYIPAELRDSDVKEYTEQIGNENRVARIDASGSVGDKIMFKAIPDYQNNYAFTGWYYREKQSDGTYKEILRSTSTSIAVTVEEGRLNTYYARFQLKSLPVVFHYTPTGSSADYDYYDKSNEYQYGRYFQEVFYGSTADEPSGDSQSVTTWYTSPTERDAEHIFDFENDLITNKTDLYAGPTPIFNYFNRFYIEEPWNSDTYGTLKINGKYVDLKNDTDVSDYNVYILKGELDENGQVPPTPTPSEIKSNRNTRKVGMSVNNGDLRFLAVTNTGQEFNRIGTFYNDFYIFNMKTPVWVVFDFRYKGVKYTSTVKDRSLYNDITTYMAEAENGFFTTFPPKTQAELRAAQTTLLLSIQGLYNAVNPFGITQPSSYADAVSVSGLTYDPATDGTYSFTSSTAIRNIEPWGLKYSFSVDGHSFSEFTDYGAVVLTDKDNTLSESSISVENILNNNNSVMYSSLTGNLYSGENGAVDIFYINNMTSSDFDKNTYAVFFVKNSQGTYYSNIVTNSYSSIAANDTSEYKDVSKSIMDYSTALVNYNECVEKAKNTNQ